MQAKHDGVRKKNNKDITLAGYNGGDRVKGQPGQQQGTMGGNGVGAKSAGPAPKHVQAPPKASNYGDEGLLMMPLGLKKQPAEQLMSR